MAAGLPLPKQLLVHAHWTMQKQKMSKSKGNVADPFQVLKDYGIDPVRYYLVRNGGIVDDSGKHTYKPIDIKCICLDYSEDMIKRMYTKDLAGQLGNLFSRATSQSLLPSGKVPLRKAKNNNDEILHEMLTKVADNFDKAFEEREFTKAFSFIFDMLAEVRKLCRVTTYLFFLKGQQIFYTQRTMELGKET